MNSRLDAKDATCNRNSSNVHSHHTCITRYHMTVWFLYDGRSCIRAAGKGTVDGGGRHGSVAKRKVKDEYG